MPITVHNTFLLDPRHEPFLEGQRGKIYTFDLKGWIFLCVLLTIISAVLLVCGLVAQWAANTWETALAQEGVTTQGTITELYTHQRSNRYGDPLPPEYYIVYEFHASGHLYTINQEVSESVYLASNNGDVLEVRYLPDNPTSARIPNGLYYDARPLLALGAAVFGGGCIAGFMGIRSRRRKGRLEQSGQLRAGRITRIRREKVRGSGNVVRIEYAFPKPDGAILKGKSSAVRNDLWNESLPPVNRQVAVLYVDDNLHCAL